MPDAADLRRAARMGDLSDVRRPPVPHRAVGVVPARRPRPGRLRRCLSRFQGLSPCDKPCKAVDPYRNPYTPNAGARPPVLVGRDDQLATFDLLLRRLRAGQSEQSMVITGLRGVGKTVLLGEFRSRADAAGWAVVEVEVSKHDDSDFRRVM